MTIMELLVGAGIALFVVGSVFSAVRVQGRSAAYQTGMADAQLTSRGAGELLLQDLRMAGFGMLGVSPADATTYPPLAVVTAGSTTTLTMRGAFSNITTTLAGSANAGQTTLNVNVPATGAFTAGNLGRNTFEGPGLNWTQLSLAKWWRIKERARVQLRLDANNFFPKKQPSFSNPNSSWTVNNPAQFGRGFGTRGSFSDVGTANSHILAVMRVEF
jgi:hypothetical protein